jgi:UDP-N-acetylmuramate: L-alanyl-gamma-D-glutamyl-meso-diaminopimelate ligase
MRISFAIWGIYSVSSTIWCARCLGQGLVITPVASASIRETLRMGCWSEHQTFGIADDPADLQAVQLEADGSVFDVTQQSKVIGRVTWGMTGRHNTENALAAILAAHHIGVKIKNSVEALCSFPGVKRRLEVLAEAGGVTVYDDFAHHPTAIQLTLEGLRKKVGDAKIWAFIEPRSNTMKMGVHELTLLASADHADRVYWANFTNYEWLNRQVAGLVESGARKHHLMTSAEQALDVVKGEPGPLHVVIMSNGGFSGLPAKMAAQVKAAANGK